MPMSSNRRLTESHGVGSFSRRAVLATLAASGVGAWAQGAYPNRSITLWVPSAAGGATDAFGRAVADSLSRRLNVPVVVENKPGAGGALAAITLSSGKPDGYTLAIAPAAIFRFSLMQKTQFDPLKDLTYISMMGGYSYGIVVPTDSPYQNLADMLAHAKANPGAVTYSHPGVGSSGHLVMEELAVKTGVKFTPVPYRGTPEAMTAVLGKQVSAMAGLIEFAPQVEAGKLRVLATLGAQRVKIFPNVPTLREQGVDLVSDGSFGICAPRGTDPTVVRVLQDALKASLDDPRLLGVYERYTMPVIYMNAREYEGFARRSVANETDLLGRLSLIRKD